MHTDNRQEQQQYSFYYSHMPKTLHNASDDDYNDLEGCIYTFRRTFPKGSVGYMTITEGPVSYITRTFPKRPVGYITRTFPKGPVDYITITFPKGPVDYTISTDNIIPPKRKSHLRTTITKYLRQINKTEYELMHTNNRQEQQQYSFYYSHMPKTLHNASDDDYNDPEGCIYTFRRTFPKGSVSYMTITEGPVGYITRTFPKGPVGYITITFPKGPVGYTISTDDNTL